MIYLGSLGRMIGIKCPASQNVQAEERYTFTRTLEGRRKAQGKPIGRRTWSLQTSDATTPSEHSLLSQFANGAWGNGPFRFISADASVSNLMTPAAADCMPGEYVLTSGLTITEGAPMLTPDGWAARSFIKSTNNGLFFGKDMLPVLPGVPVTVSAYVRGNGGAVNLVWYDSAGSSISVHYGGVTAGSTNTIRSWLTEMPPANAVSFRFQASSAVQQVSRPAATWSDRLLPYGDGQGCVKAVVSAMTRDQVLAVPGSTYSNVSFTVTEVG